MYQRYKEKGVRFVGIFVEDREDRAREFIKGQKLTFPVGYDWELKLAKPMGFRGMPYTVVLDRRGGIAKNFAGPISKADLTATIDSLLEN